MRLFRCFILLVKITFALGCEIELGHQDLHHDHDGDGIADHAPQDH